MREVIYGFTFLLFVACSHSSEQKRDLGAGRGMAADAPAVSVTTIQPVVAACGADENCGPKQLCIRSVCTDISGSLAECAAVRIFFDPNSTEIGPNGRQLLSRAARCLKADQRLNVTISGGADSAGAEAYNRELGDKRASAVAAYLEQQGVSREQLKTISFGEERPLCWTEDADCMAKNRRATVRPQPKK